MSRVLLPFEKAFRTWVTERGMGWKEVNVQLPHQGETTRAYRLAPVEEARGVVVALHGAGNDALFAWVGLFKRLLSSGMEVFTFDLPGHGRQNRSQFTTDDAVAAFGAALDRCVGPGPCLPAHAIGVSLGGAVLLGALPRLQPRLTSAVLLVSPIEIHLSARSLARELSPRNVGVLWREREHYGWTGLIPSFGPFKRAIYPLRMAGPVPAGPFGYVDALNRYLAAMDLEAAARRVNLPTLLIYGDRDRVVHPEQGERLATLIAGAELYRVRGGTHLSTPLEPEVTERILAWVGVRR